MKDTRAFDPDRVAQLTAAFEDALQKMGSVGRNDPAALAITRHIIELAKQGESATDRRRVREWDLNAPMPFLPG